MDFLLRPWQENDVSSLLKYADNPTIARYMTDKFISPYTQDQGKRFIQYAMNADPLRIFAIAVQEEAVGAIGIHPQSDIEQKNAELGYWLGEPFWGKGIMTAAIQQIVEYGFTTWEINRVFARPFGSNTGSQRALEKAGFQLEARLEQTLFKNGEYEDELIYAVRRAG